MRPLDHGDDLLELRPPAAVLVDADVEDKAPAPEQPQALDELGLQHRPRGLVLQQVPEPLHLLPDALAAVPFARLAHRINVPLQRLGPRRQRRPGHDPQAQRGVLVLVALPRARPPAGDARQPRHLGQRVSPPALRGGVRLVVLAVRLEEDEAREEVVLGRRGRAVLCDGVLPVEGALGLGPGEGVELARGEEVDVGVDYGDRGRHLGLWVRRGASCDCVCSLSGRREMCFNAISGELGHLLKMRGGFAKALIQCEWECMYNTVYQQLELRISVEMALFKQQNSQNRLAFELGQHMADRAQE